MGKVCRRRESPAEKWGISEVIGDFELCRLNAVAMGLMLFIKLVGYQVGDEG